MQWEYTIPLSHALPLYSSRHHYNFLTFPSFGRLLPVPVYEYFELEIGPVPGSNDWVWLQMSIGIARRQKLRRRIEDWFQFVD